MKNSYKLIAFFAVAFVTLFSVHCFSKSQAARFSDVPPEEWYAQSVSYAFEKGLMKGTGEDTFEPDGKITRGMIVTILHRLEKSPMAAKALSFADVPKEAYYYAPISWATENGIVNGHSETVFAPDDNITREQLAAILHRYATFKQYTIASTDEALLQYEDAESISPYAVESMLWANKTGLIKGVTETTLEPQGQATRAQAATIFMRFDGLFEADAEETVEATVTTSVSTTSSKPAETAEPIETTVPQEQTTTAEVVITTEPTVTSAETTSAADEPQIITAPTFKVCGASANVGEKSVEIDVLVVNNPGILGMTLKVEYDESAITLVSASNGDALSKLTMQGPKKYKSPCNFVWYGEALEESDIKDGGILRLKFDISDTATAGEYPIKLSYTDGDIFDANLAVINIDVKNANIRIN